LPGTMPVHRNAQLDSSGLSTSTFGKPAATMRRGTGVLLTEPSPGQDTVYDGATQMKSTAFLFGSRGARWTSPQVYDASFRSKTPRPWQRRPLPNLASAPSKVGPGDYEPFGDTHSLSASLSWTSRGRTGPTGYAFRLDTPSPQFTSAVDRFHYAARPKRGMPSQLKEDAFVLASDARREQLQRRDFVDQLQVRVQNSVFMPPQPMRLMTAPGMA